MPTPLLSEQNQKDFYVRPDMAQSNPYLSTLFWDFDTNTPPVDINIPMPRGAEKSQNKGYEVTLNSEGQSLYGDMPKNKFLSSIGEQVMNSMKQENPDFDAYPRTSIPQEWTNRYLDTNADYYQRLSDNEDRQVVFLCSFS